MARIDWVDQRLDRWSMWIIRGKSAGGTGGMHPMFRQAVVDECLDPTASIPINDEECWQTDTAIKALAKTDPAVAETVALYYLKGTQACQLGMRISKSVMSQRLERAHRQLALMWSKAGPVSEQLPTSFRT